MQDETIAERVPVGLGVFIVIFNKNFSKILLIKRNEEKRKKWGAEWGNIGGKIESREHSLDAAIREAREETCLNLNKDNIKLLEIKELPNFSKTHHGIHFAYATSINEDTPITINSESEGYCWFEINNLPTSTLDKKEDLIRFRDKAMQIFEIRK